MFQELHLSGWVWKYNGKISLQNTTRCLKSNNLILFKKEAECERNCYEYEFSPSFSSFKRWLIKCWVKIIKYNCVCLCELWYSKKMRISQNWGKNYPIDDAYSLITINTNGLDGDGESQIHSGGTAAQINQYTACRSIAWFIQNLNYNNFKVFFSKILWTLTQKSLSFTGEKRCQCHFWKQSEIST